MICDNTIESILIYHIILEKGGQMRKFLFIIVFGIILLSGCAKSLNTDPVTAVTIEDEIYYHNASITFDGEHYFTLNGGNADWAVVNEYNKEGKLLNTYEPPVDGRSFFFSKKDNVFYVKPYDISLYTMDLKADELQLVDSHWWSYWDDNSSIGFSPNGEKVFERIDDWVYVINMEDGIAADSFEVAPYDYHSYNMSCAASDKYVFTWADADKINAYTYDGKYKGQIKLPREGYGFSLSYCNGMLWIAKDADASDWGGTGFWYGYKVE